MFEDEATDFEVEQLYQSLNPCLASVFLSDMAHFDTSVARTAVSAHWLSGSRLVLHIYPFSPRLHLQSCCWKMY